MKIYKCDLCNKTFNRKCNYADHIKKKKKPCQQLDVLPPHKTAQNGTNFLLDLDMNDIFSTNEENTSEVNNNSNKIICNYCDKEFIRQDSLTRHIKKFCKIKMQNDNKDKLIEKMAEEIEILKNFIMNSDNKQFYSELFVDNDKNDLDKTKVVVHPLVNTKVLNNNLLNSNNKTTNNIQNNNVQVNISGFGKEDLEKLNILEAMKVYLKSTGGNIISNMLKFINMNEKYPQNHNICMTDLSREIVKMHNGKKYIYKKFKNAKYDIVDKVVGNINEIVTKYKDGNYKKSDDINSKININNISLKLISGEEIDLIDIEETLNDTTNNKNLDKVDKVKKQDNSDNSDSEGDEEVSEQKLKYILDAEHYNSKKEGLQKITYEKLKEELYNGKKLLTEPE